MINLSIVKRAACLTATAFVFFAISGCLTEVKAQRDPFKKPGWATPKQVSTGSGSGVAKLPAPPKPVIDYGPPAIEARIDYYKRVRETAVANGTAPPKVTSVLTLNEMAVTGIFKTPRGYAAMVEATPIKLSYTIYPGEKFFDGQLVAVEENRLVFRKVTKVGEGKFVASVENKPLQQYSTKAQIEGTAPSQPSEKQVETASIKGQTSPSENPVKPNPNRFVSPLDEMNRMPTPAPESEKADPKKSTSKPVKLAKNVGQK
jgi:hypothetical protein